MSTDSIPQEAPPVKPDLDALWASARRALDSFLRAELAADAAWDRYKAGNLDAPPDFDAWQQMATDRERASMEWDRALVNYRRAFQQISAAPESAPPVKPLAELKADLLAADAAEDAAWAAYESGEMSKDDWRRVLSTFRDALAAFRAAGGTLDEEGK